MFGALRTLAVRLAARRDRIDPPEDPVPDPWPVDVHPPTSRPRAARLATALGQVGGVHVHLRRDAPDVHACAPERALLDDRDVEIVELRTRDRVARAGADDHEVVVPLRHPSISCVGAASSAVSSASRSSSAVNARPRWLSACFSPAVISANVRPSPSAGHEHAVVAEAARPALGRGDRARRTRPRRQTRGRRATRPSRPCGTGPAGRPGPRGELGEQLGPVVGVAGIRRRRSDAVSTPGAPPSASTSSPVSSATAGSPLAVGDRRRLQPGVADQRVGVLDDVGHAGRAREELDDVAEDRLRSRPPCPGWPRRRRDADGNRPSRSARRRGDRHHLGLQVGDLRAARPRRAPSS